MGGGAPDGRTRPDGLPFGRWSACQNVQSQKFGQTANLFYPIISANREKSRDGKATELRCVFVLFRNFSHYVGRVAT